jgi:pimeloyl-ACP methyl ester carboxylesterase
MRVSLAGCFASFWCMALLALGGCSALALRAIDFAQPTVRTELAAAGIADLRGQFAPVFCRHYSRYRQAGEPACGHWLAGAEAPETHPVAVLSPPGRPLATVVLIPGIFGECVGRWVTPYSHDRAELERLGYRVVVVPVSGRGSSELNAGQIHAFFAETPVERAIVIAYSKGTLDFMTAAAQPQAQSWSKRIGAFVSVAGVVNGTPLASHGETLYDTLLARMPLSLCQAQDGGGVASLAYLAAAKTRNAFAALSKPYPSYSLAAVADERAVNPVLQQPYTLLARLDGRNDGQVLLEDAILPGSGFLGTFRADHWSLTLPFEDSQEPLMRAFGTNNHFPRRALITAVLDFVNSKQPGENK